MDQILFLNIKGLKKVNFKSNKYIYYLKLRN